MSNCLNIIFSPVYFNFYWSSENRNWSKEIDGKKIIIEEKNVPQSFERAYKIFIDSKLVFDGVINSKMFGLELFTNLKIFKAKNG